MTYPWEFGYFVDEHRRDTGFAVVRGHPGHPHQREFLKRMRRDHRIIGMTCQGVFPMIGELPGNLPKGKTPREGRHEEYLGVIEGWAHCFREPNDYLPRGAPRIRFCNSDNLNPDRVWEMATKSGTTDKKWDFIYSCMPEPANVVRKNWALAKQCALRFAAGLGLRGLLVGVAGLNDVPAHPLIEVRPQLKWAEFLNCIRRSRVAFFPNTWDPSPRLMAEALCLDVPLLVNRNILGGWHYVCESTGRFFTDEHDAVDGFISLRSNHVSPREWYVANHGAKHAGPRLAEFLRLLAASEGRTTAWESASFYSPRDWGKLPKPSAQPATNGASTDSATPGQSRQAAPRRRAQAGERASPQA
jgi:hypothetical protein